MTKIEAINAIQNAAIVERAGRQSDNALTILANVLRNRDITAAEQAVALAHDFTDAQIVNVLASIGRA